MDRRLPAQKTFMGTSVTCLAITTFDEDVVDTPKANFKAASDLAAAFRHLSFLGKHLSQKDNKFPCHGPGVALLHVNNGLRQSTGLATQLHFRP